jgi:hypothetical protein
MAQLPRMKAICIALILTIDLSGFFVSCFVQSPLIGGWKQSMRNRGLRASLSLRPPSPQRSAARLTVSMAAADGKEATEKSGSEQALLWADQLSKTWDGTKYQFRDASFVLSRGERAGLIGVNGVGEMIRCICDLSSMKETQMNQDFSTCFVVVARVQVRETSAHNFIPLGTTERHSVIGTDDIMYTFHASRMPLPLLCALKQTSKRHTQHVEKHAFLFLGNNFIRVILGTCAESQRKSTCIIHVC